MIRTFTLALVLKLIRKNVVCSYTHFFTPILVDFSDGSSDAMCSGVSGQARGPVGTWGAIPARRNLRVAPASSRQYSMHRDVNQTSLAGTLASARLRQNQRLERID